MSCPVQLHYPICSDERTSTPIQVTKEMGAVVNVMTEGRNDLMVCLGAEKMAADCGVKPSMAPLCLAQRGSISVQADT